MKSTCKYYTGTSKYYRNKIHIMIVDFRMNQLTPFYINCYCGTEGVVNTET
jgi:hypothetical protein